MLYDYNLPTYLFVHIYIISYHLSHCMYQVLYFAFSINPSIFFHFIHGTQDSNFWWLLDNPYFASIMYLVIPYLFYFVFNFFRVAKQKFDFTITFL